MTDTNIDLDLKAVISVEQEALQEFEKNLDPGFSALVRKMTSCAGRVVLTGIGKSGLIARKIVATLCSTGTSALFLNPVEGMHGDLGVLRKDDLVLVLSWSGATEELLRILPFIRRQGVFLCAMTSGKDSELARNSDLIALLPPMAEACPFNLAPTTSTTLQLVAGDALAIAVLKQKGFTDTDFAQLHPGGSLGRQFIRIKEIMKTGDELPLIEETAGFRDVLDCIISGKKGVALIVNKAGKLTGIVVDGDLKRILLERSAEDLFQLLAKDIMTPDPEVISPDRLVTEALSRMQGRITSLPVTDQTGKPLGLLHVHDILQKGFV